MDKIIKICSALFFLLFLRVQNSDGQIWLWAKGEYPTSVSSGCVPEQITTDKSGNIIEIGDIVGSAQVGSYTINSSPSGNAVYIAKYDQNGNVLWVTTQVQQWLEEAHAYAVATDAVGNFYVSGSFQDTIQFGTYRLTTEVRIGPFEGFFLAKFNPNGNIKWLIGPKYSNGSTSGDGVATDAAGNVYLLGAYSGILEIGNDTLVSGPDSTGMFLAKYDSNGTFKWLTGATDGGGGYVLASDGSANLYVTGVFYHYLSAGSYYITDTYPYNGDQALLKYDSSGNLIWLKNALLNNSSSMIAPSSTSRLAISTNVAGDIYITADYAGSVSFGSYTLSNYCTGSSAFIAKYNSSGNVIWAEAMTTDSSYCGTSEGSSISADNWGNIYLGGNMTNVNTLGGMTIGNIGYGRNFLMKLDGNGTALCASVINGFEYSLNGVAADPVGPNVYFAANDLEGDWTFGNTTLTGIGNWSYVAKWTCDSCRIPVNIATSNSTICPGDTTTIAASGSSGYIWSTGSTTDSIMVSPSITTIYAVYVSNGTCAGDTSITIHVNSSPLPIITSSGKICIGESDTISISGGTGYKWSNGDTTSTIIVSPISNTNYTVLVYGTLCSIHDSTSVLVFPYPLPSISTMQSICSGQSANLLASGGSAYLWSTGSTISSISVTPLTSTIYSVIVSNGYCSTSDSVTVVVNPLPNATVCCDTSIIPGSKVQLISSGGDNYSWSPSNGLSCDTCPNPFASPSHNTTYTLTITSDSGCAATGTVTIDVSCGEVFIPNVFSPNQTGYNNILYVRGQCIAQMDFCVFDRWGNKVFESQNPNQGWDGTFKGQPMSMATYMWFVKATLIDGTSIEKKGNVTLVR